MYVFVVFVSPAVTTMDMLVFWPGDTLMVVPAPPATPFWPLIVNVAFVLFGVTVTCTELTFDSATE